MTSYQVPMNLAAERDLLGILLYDPIRYADAEAVISAIDFADPRHQLLFAAIGGLRASGVGVSLPAVFERVKTQGDFESLGSEKYLLDLADNAPMSTMAADMAKLIAEVSLRRRIYYLAQEWMGAASVGAEKPDQVISRAETALSATLRGAGIGDAWQDGEALNEAVAGVLRGDGKATYLKTGIRDFDEKVGGLVMARCNYFPARPSMGKSALAVCMGVNIAKGVDGPPRGVGMFSLEMDVGELGLRAACAAAFRRGEIDNPMYFLANQDRLTDGARESLAWGASSLRGLPLFFDDRPGLKPSQIIPGAKRLIRRWEKAKIEPGCIIVDHLHIVQPDEKSGNKIVDVAEISGAFRDAARETGIPWVILCQMSREVDSRKVADKRPQLSDIRWAGEIEQDAAQITFLLRPEKYLRPPESGDADYDAKFVDYQVQKDRWHQRLLLLNEKNRGGPTAVECEAGIDLGCNAIWDVMA